MGALMSFGMQVAAILAAWQGRGEAAVLCMIASGVWAIVSRLEKRGA